MIPIQMKMKEMDEFVQMIRHEGWLWANQGSHHVLRQHGSSSISCDITGVASWRIGERKRMISVITME